MNSKLKTKNWFSSGSALILTVVLTTLLAIVGVAFVLVARVDKMSTSAIAENKQLNLAVDSVVAAICQRLTEDVPGMQSWQEYYDYPGYTRAPGADGTLFTPDDVVTGDSWLASLEPRIDASLSPPVYYWPQISDIYEAVPGSRVGLLEAYGVGDWWEAGGFGDKVQPHNLRAQIIPEANSVSGAFDAGAISYSIDFGGPADADGDGVADSRWVAVPDMTSKGRDIYAAVRIVDNGGMLNVNTAYKLFDPEGNPGPNAEYVDGSSQMQINLMALAERGTTYSPQEESDRLLSFRCGNAPNDIRSYEYNVVRRYEKPNGPYTPFDISDELKLRNRYILNYNRITTKIERMWTWGYDEGIEMPRVRSDYLQTDPEYWFYRTNNSCPYDPCLYDYRHISTTYNMDRIINPNGFKMFGVNRINPVAEPNVIDLYRAIRVDIGDDALAAQIAANIKDYGDADCDVTVVNGQYGFERPCIYISELAYHYLLEQQEMGGPRPPEHISYAIELRQRYWGTNTDQWRIVITYPDRDPIEINVTDFSNSRNRYRVIVFEDPCASLAEDVLYSDSPADEETGVDPDVILRWDPLTDVNISDSYDIYFGADRGSVRDATATDDSNGVYQGRKFIGAPEDTEFDPYGPPPGGAMATGDTYYWRIDDINSLDPNEQFVDSTGVLSFTTWAAEPNSIYDIIGPNSPRIFEVGTVVGLERILPDGTFLRVDEKIVLPVIVPPVAVQAPVAPEPPVEMNVSIKRDVSGGSWIKRIWDDVTAPPSLGNSTGHYFAALNPIQARPANQFRNVGEIGLVLRKSAYLKVNDLLINPLNVIGPVDNEFTARLNLADPNVQQFFRYLTRFDPSMMREDNIDNDGDNLVNETAFNLTPEFKIAGRININTAPWYVIAQLPWVSPHTPNYELARAIVAYRDKLDLSVSGGPDYYQAGAVDSRAQATGISFLREQGGFASTGELNNVIAGNREYDMRYHLGDGDQLTFPDLTHGGGRSLGDGYPDDFEERDLIFARISDLVTVRSDVFTAYILVRMGTDGPQKRVIAILDRSDVYPNTSGRVKIRAVHQVPDPR